MHSVLYVSYIPFEVPCESNTQGAENKKLKIGMLLEISEKKLISALMDKNNPNFLHILLTSVIICNCDKSVITKSHMWSLFAITTFRLGEGTIRWISTV